MQSLIDRGAPLNFENFYPLHWSIWLHTMGSTFKSITINCFYRKYECIVGIIFFVTVFNEDIFKLLIKNGAYLETIDVGGIKSYFTPL